MLGWEHPLPKPPRSQVTTGVRSGPTYHSFIQHVIVACLLRASKYVRHFFFLCDRGQVTISARASLICKIRAPEDLLRRLL